MKKMADTSRGHQPKEDDIVITGISGCFPAADDIDEFRDKLFSKEYLVRPKEEYNWNNEKLGIPNFIGQVSNKNKFDAGFFGVNPKHCASTDPFVRMLLEKAFEAIVDAGLNPNELRGTNTAVFTGSNISESENTYIYIPVKNNLAVMGHSRAMVSNRISYWLNVHGTSISMVSMETSGFEALSAAYNEMKKGRCDAAVVGAVNLVMHPEMSYQYKELGVLSNDGKCRVFDAAADGYARSEGITVLFLQRAKDAKRIYATVVNSEFDGCGDRNIRFPTPYGKPLGTLMEHFYETCGVNPTEIAYLEAEGCGTKLGDEEEMKAIDKILLNDRKMPLLIGSVKSNMGHSNAAANLCSVAKVLIAMQSGILPPNLHYSNPAPGISALTDGRVKVVTENTPWNGGYVALNGMGMTGTYAHVLLQSYGKDKPRNAHDDGLPRLIITSSRTEEGIKNILNKLETKPVDIEFIRLLHDVHSANINNHLYRGYTIVPPVEKSLKEIQHYDQSNRPLWFVFSGMGSQWRGMGKDLLKLPLCAESLEKCHSILAKKGLDLKHIITSDDPHIFDNILHCFVGIAAIQIALVDMLTALCIEPDGMVGHSVGELGCAYADRCFTLEQMILAAYYRGWASQQADLIEGSMAAVGIGYNQMKKFLPVEIDIACHNSSDSCTLSGPTTEVKSFLVKLQQSNIFARAVNVANIAYHSRYILNAAPYLLESLKKLIPDPNRRSSRWVCSSVPEEKWDTPLAQYCSAEYHTNNLLSPVLFEEASKHIPKNAVVIEIAPHGLLQAILRRSLDSECTNISLTQRGHPRGLHFLLTAIGKLYLTGMLPQVQALYPPVQFPVSRGTPSISPLIRWDHTDSWYTVGEVDYSELISGEREILVSLNQEEFRGYAGYTINGNILFPPLAFLKIVWETIATLRDTTISRLPVVFEDVRFINHLHIEKRASHTLYVLVQRGSGEFEITNDKALLVTGRVLVPENVKDRFVKHLATPTESIKLNGDDFYKELERRGYQYKEPFKEVRRLFFGNEGIVAKVKWEDNWVVFGEALLQLLTFQSIDHAQLPATIQKIVINPMQHGTHSQEMEAVSYASSRVVQCGGMEIFNFKTTPAPQLSQKMQYSLEAMRFITTCNSNIQTLHQFVSMSLQCVLQNTCSPVYVTSMESEDSSLLLCIKSLLPQYSQIILKNKNVERPINVIVVASEYHLEDLSHLIDPIDGFILIAVDKNFFLESSNLVVLFEKQFENEKILLLRKVMLPNKIKQDIIHPNRNPSTWLQQIKAHASCDRLYVVMESKLQGVDAIFLFIRQIMKSGLTYVRFVLIMDKMAPKFCLNETLYNEQLQKDLIVNIYHNGGWGIFSHIPLESSISDVSDLDELDLLFAQSLEDIVVEYLGPNQYDTSCLKKETIEFSGISKSGERLMGIIKKGRRQIQNDKLRWIIPQSWTLEEAVTVPIAYTIAYYSLIMTARMRYGEQILIHEGWNNIGQAAITLALSYNCNIYTTVTNTEQRLFLKKRFPKLSENHIYSCEDTIFETHILTETDGKGVHIIINSLSGSKLQASLNCLADHGRFIQLGNSDLIRNQILGMGIFLKSTAVFGVSVNNFFSLSVELQEALHSGIQKSIKRGVIQPLKYTVFSRQQTQQAYRMLSDTNQIQRVVLSTKYEKSEKYNVQQKLFPCDAGTFYLIIGAKMEECLDVAEWLTSYRISQVAIAVRNKTTSNYIDCKIKLLNSYHGMKVVIIPSLIVNSLKSAVMLIQRSSAMLQSTLAGIFILPLEAVGQENCVTASTVSNLDMATRSIISLKHFVCLLMEDNWSICEARHEAGLPALAVLWQGQSKNTFNLSHSLHALDILFNSMIQDSVIFVHEDNKGIKSDNNVIPPLDLLIPSTIEDVINLGKDLLSDSQWIVELPSLSPGLKNIKEVPPVFIIPGLQGPACNTIKTLSRKIMYPVLCIRLKHTDGSIKEMAESLVKLVKEKQNSGQYNLVGISWGGTLALELATRLEAQGCKTRVIIVDGAAETIQSAIQGLGKESSLMQHILSRILHISINKVSDNLDNLLNETKDVKENNKKEFSVAIKTVCYFLKTLLNYKPPGELLKSEIALIRPSGSSEVDNCGLDLFFKQTVNIHVVEGGHMSILSSSHLAAIINDFIV